MSGAAKSGSSKLLTTVWGIACAWLLGSLVGLGACVGASTFHRGIRKMLAQIAILAAELLTGIANQLLAHPVIGMGILVGGIAGIIWGRRRTG